MSRVYRYSKSGRLSNLAVSPFGYASDESRGPRLIPLGLRVRAFDLADGPQVQGVDGHSSGMINSQWARHSSNLHNSHCQMQAIAEGGDLVTAYVDPALSTKPRSACFPGNSWTRFAPPGGLLCVFLCPFHVTPGVASVSSGRGCGSDWKFCIGDVLSSLPLPAASD